MIAIENDATESVTIVNMNPIKLMMFSNVVLPCFA
jgi:hypothetical protein